MVRSNRFVLAGISTLALATSGFVVVMAPVQAAVAAQKDKDNGEQPKHFISRKVGKALEKMSKALSEQKFDDAQKYLKEAQDVSKRTPFDDFKIEQFRAQLYIQQKSNYPEIFAIFEKFFADPQYLEPKELEILPKQLTQLAYQLKQNDKVQKYGKIWLDTHPDDTSVMDMMLRSSYIAKDYKSTLDMLNVAIPLVEKSGKVPEEIWLELVPSCADNLGDEKQVYAGYQKLVRYYPKQVYWGRLLERALRGDKSDLDVLNLLRLMDNIGILKQPENYLDYSQLATHQALPGEAYRVLQAGFDAKILGQDPKKKVDQERRLTDAKHRYESDHAQLPSIEKDVSRSKSKSGQASVGLGLAYYSFEMYDKAIDAITAGMAKGGVRDLDAVRMVLGISYMHTGQKDKAREVFQSVPADSQVARAANLWAIRTYN